jgi:transcription elongation factor GreA
MTSTGRVSISTQAHQRLERELAVLRELLSTAVDDGDDEKTAAAVRRARNARIQRIHELLCDAAVGEDRPDDRVAAHYEERSR